MAVEEIVSELQTLDESSHRPDVVIVALPVALIERVWNAKIDQFKSPIYRIVNGPDPVPFVPPSGYIDNTLKAVFRLVGAIFPFAGFTEWATTS